MFEFLKHLMAMQQLRPSLRWTIVDNVLTVTVNLSGDDVGFVGAMRDLFGEEA